VPEVGGAVGVDRGFRDGVGVDRGFRDGVGLERRLQLAGVAGVGYGVCRCAGVGILDFTIGDFVVTI
jgi:hypothetical protein